MHNPTELVCSSAQKIVAFSVATVLELLEARGANDQRVRHLFLFVVNGLKCIHGEHIRTISSAEIQPILSDWCKGSCMIIALLSKKVTFTKPLMKSIVTNLTNSFIASVNGTYIDVVDRILDVFLILSNSQKLKHIGKLIDALCYSDKPQFVHEFVALLERKNETYDIRPFVMKLLDCIIQEMTELVSSNSKKANTNSVGKVDKTADLACRLISITDSSVAITALKGVLTIVITIKVSDTKILSGCYSIIQSVSNLYSSEFDEVIKVILSNIEKTSTTDGRNPTEVKASINKFLQNTFAGQKYKLPDSSGTSLLLGLNSPVEQIKIASLHSFHKLISSSSNEDRPEYVKDMQGLSVAACACMTSHSMDVSIAAWNSNISKIVAKYAVHDLYLSLSYSHQHWLQSFLVDKNKSSCEVLMNIWSSINEDSVLHALSASDNSSESNLLAANRIEWLFRTVLDLLCKAKANFVAESDGKQSSNDLWVKSTNLYYSMAVSLGKILPIWKGLNVVNKTNSVSTLFEKCVDVMSKNCKSHSSIALLERYCNQSYTNYSFDKNLSNIIASLELIVGISSNCSDDEIKEKILTFVIPLFALACENCATEDEGMQDLLVQLTQNLVIAIGNSDTYANSANVLPEIDGSEISDLLSSLRSGVSIADIRGRVACAILSSVGSKVITELGNTLTVFYGKNPHKYLLSIAGSNSVDEKSGRCLLNSSFLMWTEVEDAVDTKVIITNVMKAVALQALATYVMSMFSRSSNTATLSTSDSASIMILLPIIISCCCDASDIVRAASLAIIKRIGRLKSAVSKLSIEASVSNYFKKLTGSALEESVFSNLVSICNLIAEKEVLISIDAAAGRTLLISEILPTNVQNDNIVMILLFTVTLMSRADITTATIILDCVVGINMLDQSWVFIQEMLCHFLTVSDIKTSVYARIAVKSLLQFNHCESYETQENIIEWLSALLESDTEENDILVDVKNEVFKLTINGSFSEADEPLLVKLYSSLIMEQLLRPGKELVLTAIRSLTVSITTPIKFLYNECKVLLNSLQSVPRESKLEDQEEGSGLALPVEKLCSLLEAVNFAFQQATDDVSIELGAITVVLFETLSALNTAQLKKIMQVEYCKCMIIDVTYYCLSVARSSIQASSVLISKTASARKSKSSKDFMEVMIDDIKLDKYASNRVEADIMRILTCLEFNGASALIQSSALKLLVLLLEINPSALLSSIKQLGDLLAKSTVVEAVNNREIIVGIMQIFTGVVSSDSCNLTWEEVFESLCQEFHNIKSFQRRQILDFVLSSTNKDEQEGLALSSIVNVLLNQTYAVSNLEESSESKSQSTFSTDTATITTILLSKSAKRKALKALATTTSEEMYMLAKEIILSRPSPIAIISTLINIISDTMDTLEGVLQIKGKMNTDDNNTLEKWERITEYCKLISSSSNIPMESLLSTRMVLQLQFIQDILEDKRLHRAIAAFIDEAGSDSLLQDQYLQFADALLQLLANANDVEERYYKSNEAVAITTSKETFTLPLSLLGLDVGSWCNKIIANVQNMMDTPSFITILQELLSHERLEVRQKAIHVLGGRLENLSKHDLKNIDEVNTAIVLFIYLQNQFL